MEKTVLLFLKKLETILYTKIMVLLVDHFSIVFINKVVTLKLLFRNVILKFVNIIKKKFVLFYLNLLTFVMVVLKEVLVL